MPYRPLVIAVGVSILMLTTTGVYAEDNSVSAQNNKQRIRASVLRNKAVEPPRHGGQQPKAAIYPTMTPTTQTVNIDHQGHPLLWFGDVPVVVAPWNTGSHYNGAERLVNAPVNNRDVYLLQREVMRSSVCLQNPETCLARPVIWLSGALQGQVRYADHYGTYQNGAGSYLGLTQTELDIAVLPNHWLAGYVALAYGNNKLFLDQGFITLGCLSHYPLYLSVGRFYVPFGQYGSALITDSTTATLGRTRARALALGFFRQFNTAHSLKITAFGFDNDRPVGSAVSRHNYGTDLQYTFTHPSWNLMVNASYLANVSDLAGIRRVVGLSAETVSGLAMGARVGIGPVYFNTSYITATRAFTDDWLSFQGRGATPEAWHMEVSYNFDLQEKPSSVSFGYDQTKEALALCLPKSRYSAAFNTSIWKNTVVGLEFRHDKDYSLSETATSPSRSMQTGTGRSMNAITLKLAAYF